jgi:hypothetical protein
MTTVAVNRIQIAKRRSSRIGLNARIGLSGQDREKRTFTMPARATNLNKHGAAIQLNLRPPTLQSKTMLKESEFDRKLPLLSPDPFRVSFDSFDDADSAV